MDQDAVARRAAGLFNSGYNCAQATSLAVNEAFGLGIEDIPRILQPFGGGVARADGMCGAVTGGVIAIGMLFGREGEGSEEARDRCYELTQRYIGEFLRRRGCVRCTDLLGYDLSDPEGRAAATEDGAPARVCPGLVEDSIGALMAAMEGEA
jgi:C_GCAxxG_C_C family probable redox protein